MSDVRIRNLERRWTPRVKTSWHSASDPTHHAADSGKAGGFLDVKHFEEHLRDVRRHFPENGPFAWGPRLDYNILTHRPMVLVDIFIATEQPVMVLVLETSRGSGTVARVGLLREGGEWNQITWREKPQELYDYLLKLRENQHD